MFVALCHDFVLRRNVRIAFQTKSSAQARDRFVHFAHGSHHLRLINQSAQQWNAACSEAKQTSLARLPELPPPALINEHFGLVGSNHVTTFGGLLSGNDMKDEPVMDAPQGDDSLETEQAMNSLISKTTELLISEYGIEEALFNVQLKGSTLHLLSSTDAQSSGLPPSDATSPAKSAIASERKMNRLVVDLTTEDGNQREEVSPLVFWSKDNLSSTSSFNRFPFRHHHHPLPSERLIP
jgi:hypothetical protein